MIVTHPTHHDEVPMAHTLRASPSLCRLSGSIRATLAAAALCSIAHGASAAEVYLQGGFIGTGIGIAQPLDENFAVRADVLTLGGSRKGDYDEEGIRYQGTLKASRAAVFGDWFVTGGGFRLSAGVGVHQAKLDLTVRGAGQQVTIGTQTVTLTASDRYDVKIEYPRVMPYLGLGYGHHRAEPGWGFVFDVGAFIGRAKVTGQASGAGFTASGLTQADVDLEVRQIEENLGDLRVLPQLTFGASYRF